MPGTQNIHHKEVFADEKGIRCLPYTGSTEFENLNACKEQPYINELQSCLGAVADLAIIPGATYVAVIYDDRWWPGVIQRMSEQKAVLSFIVPQEPNKFKWPKK